MRDDDGIELPSPWRRAFEQVRRATGNRRDEDGVVGSINWLRKRMAANGANPNVVRNIIYRDKGRLSDKQVLFNIFDELWRQQGQGPLHLPEIEALLSPNDGAGNEMLQLLGKEKRRAFRTFVEGVGSGATPKLLITGRPGSGKTMLLDYVQEALGAGGRGPGVVRVEFVPGCLSSALTRLAADLGISPQLVESKVTRVSASGAFAVQADAQAEVARTILEGARALEGPLVLLAHVSSSNGGEEKLGGAPLRLNTAEVPRVSTPEWLWLSLFEPLSRAPGVALLVSMTELPARIAFARGGFGEPLRLNPPTSSEAKRFVRARLPGLDSRQQDAVARRAGRSFEELRTLTLLCEVREALPRHEAATGEEEQHLGQLAKLVLSKGHREVADFLAAVAVLSLPEYPLVEIEALRSLLEGKREPSELELAFLDPVPSQEGHWRVFSRDFARLLRATLLEGQPERYQTQSLLAARHYRAAAQRNPGGAEAGRHLLYLLAGRDWEGLASWLERFEATGTLIGPIWEAAQTLEPGVAFERIARQVACHYVRIGCFDHPDAVHALAVLEGSNDHELSAWSLIQRAEGEVARGRVDRAEELLRGCATGTNPLRNAELALVKAGIARWRSSLEEAARLVEEGARELLTPLNRSDRETQAALAKAAMWSGVIAKDRGDLERALQELEQLTPVDGLVAARVAFQRGDILVTMGRFDAALAALDQAVALAAQAPALMSNQARFLSRRGTLRRRRGELQLALADFQAAQNALRSAGEQGDPGFELLLAHCNEEHALALLATGAYDRAIYQLGLSIATFCRHSRFEGSALCYRLLRSKHRLALAYLFRGLAQPYTLPFRRSAWDVPESADTTQAKSLHRSVEEAFSRNSAPGPVWLLRRNSRLLGSLLAADPQEALVLATSTLADARLPYHCAESHAFAAWSSLGLNDPERALVHADEARRALDALAASGESSDAGLRTWSVSISVNSLLRLGRDSDAAELLTNAFCDPRLVRCRKELLQAFGEAVEANGSKLPLEYVVRRLGLEPVEAGHGLRPPDRLIASLPDGCV